MMYEIANVEKPYPSDSISAMTPGPSMVITWSPTWNS